jgi:prophage regulatory protein
MTEILPLSSIAMIRQKQLQACTGLSRSAIYDRLNPQSPRHDPTFPKQVHLGCRAVGFVESEVLAWLQSRISLRRRAKGGQNA